MMNRVGIFTKIYRLEDSIYKALDSIFNQRYTNWKLYILVTENSKRTIENYVNQRDNVELIVGGPRDGFTTNASYIANDGNDFICTIDADDWVDERYIEVLVENALKNNADFTAMGNCFVDMNNNLLSKRSFDNVVLDIDELKDKFGECYGAVRTIWGKLFSASLLKDFQDEFLPSIEQHGGYGGDTLFILYILRTVKRICMINQELYYYRMSNTSASSMLKEGRLKSDKLLFEYAEETLKELGALNVKNHIYIFVIYGFALVDTVKLILKTGIPEREKEKDLLLLFDNDLTRQFADFDRKGIYRGENNCFSRQFFCMIFEFPFKDIGTSEFYQIWNIWFGQDFPDLTESEYRMVASNVEWLKLLSEGEKNKVNECIIQSYGNMIYDDIKLSFITKRIQDDDLRDEITEELIYEYPKMCAHVVNCEYGEALNCCTGIFENDGEVRWGERILNIWIRLAVILENANAFVLGKQIQVEMLSTKDKVAARKEYELLQSMGVDDDNMEYLKQLF